MTTEHLPARVETWFCEECSTGYGSQLAAARCAQLDAIEND